MKRNEKSLEIKTMTNKIANNDKDLLIELIKTSFKIRYHNSLLGFAWVLLKPFMMFLVLYFVFSGLNSNTSIRNFTIYLLSGVIIFTFINEGITYGLNSLLEKANIILKVNFNRTVAIVSSDIMAVINLSINLLILGLFIIFNPVAATPLSLLYFFFNIFVIALGIAAVSFFISILYIKLRDLQNVIELLLQLLFYGSAIFYTVDQLPGNLKVIFELNPIYILIQSARYALINGEFIFTDRVLIIAVSFMILFMIGKSYFAKQVKIIAEYF